VAIPGFSALSKKKIAAKVKKKKKVQHCIPNLSASHLFDKIPKYQVFSRIIV